MQLKAKKFTYIVIAALILPVVSVLAYNIYIDPFQIFHKDFQQPTVILGGRGTDRYQQAGIINQYEIKSIIIGHSHSANYLPSKLAKELGWNKVYSLTMDGAPLYEQTMVAKHAFSNHVINKVLWGLSVDHNLMAPWDMVNEKLPLEKHLYDNNRLNDLNFFLTLDLQKYYRRKQNRRKNILSADNTLELQKKEFDEATAWYSRELCGFNRPVFVASKILKKKNMVYDEVAIKKLALLAQQEVLRSPPETKRLFNNYKDNLSNNLLPIVTQNRSTEFHFVLTAYPTLLLQKKKIINKAKYKIYLQIIRQFILDTQHLNNVNIFAFDIEKFTSDLRLYKDPRHYHIAVNNYIIAQIAQRNGLLNPGNIDEYILEVDKKVTNFRLPAKWNPHENRKKEKVGYLSLDAARLLIDSGDKYSDKKITNFALQDTPLPKCAANIKRFFRQTSTYKMIAKEYQ